MCFPRGEAAPAPAARRVTFEDDLARNGIGDAEPASQVFQRVAERVEQRDHLRPRRDETPWLSHSPTTQ